MVNQFPLYQSLITLKLTISDPLPFCSFAQTFQDFNDVAVAIVAALEIVRGSLEATSFAQSLQSHRYDRRESRALCMPTYTEFAAFLTRRARARMRIQTKNLAELCVLLVDDEFGELPSVRRIP